MGGVEARVLFNMLFRGDLLGFELHVLPAQASDA